MKIAVSGCLLGQSIRFDKGDKRDSFIMDELSSYTKFISFCPEYLAFGSPRPSIRMVQEKENLNILSNKTGENLATTLLEKSHQELEKIKAQNIRAIIFKSKPPTCGLISSKVYQTNGNVEAKDDGVFAALCRKEFGYLPMEEEGRLNDKWLRENFVMQVFAYDDFEKFKEDAQMKDLVAFHQAYKFLLQSKDENIYRELGQIVENHEPKTFDRILKEYEQKFKIAISKKSSIGKTRNVLEHMAGFVKNFLNSEEKKFLHEQIIDYAKKIVPVIVPLSTLKIYATKYDVKYLLGQKFLNPYPKELALRSDIKSVR